VTHLLLTVGKPKTDHARAGIELYRRRLKPYGGCGHQVVRACRAAGGRSQAEIISRQDKRIVDALQDRDRVWALDLRGRGWSSKEWARRLDQARLAGTGRLVLVIGGALGLGETVLQRADSRVSLGPITLPHELAAVVALEQLYRGHTILAGTPYHRA